MDYSVTNRRTPSEALAQPISAFDAVESTVQYSAEALDLARNIRNKLLGSRGEPEGSKLEPVSSGLLARTKQNACITNNNLHEIIVLLQEINRDLP